MTATTTTATTVPAAIPHPSFAEAFRAFGRIGLLSFGGPAGQIAMMHKVLVEEKRWISEERFLHALNYCMLLPGPEAMQLATYVGWLLHGVRGGVMAGALFVLPGFLVILALSIVYALFARVAAIEALFFGLKAAVLAIVFEAVLRVGKRALRNRLMVGFAALAFVALFFFDVPFPVVVFTAGLIGFLGAQMRPELFKGSGHGAAKPIDGPFLDLPEPQLSHSLGRALGVIGFWGALWGAPVLLLATIFGSHSVFLPIAGFFSKMAVVTFGGAYAVLSYVAQAAVTDLGWLRPGEMLDGLALAETTPGPLILVLTYVGFLAAFRAAPGIEPLTAGLIGATLTTWVTFIPCFLWIFLGAPYVEALRANVRLSGALSAITAAVTGVVLNLAVWFALHVLFREVGKLSLGPLAPPWPRFGSLDPAALGLALVALVAIFRFRLGMVLTLVLCAVLGVGLRLAF